MQARSRWSLAAGLLAVCWGAQAQQALLEGTGFYGFDTGSSDPTLLNVVRTDAYSLFGSFVDPGRQYFTQGRVSARTGQLGVAVRPDFAGYDFQIRSRANFSDYLTFSSSGVVTLRTKVNGEVASLGPDAKGSLVFSIETGTADGQRGGQGVLSFSTPPNSTTAAQLSCTPTVVCAASAALGLPSFDLTFAFNVLANTPYRFSGDLSAIGRNNMAIFFNNTATMSFDLEPGMTMSSRSGVFLTPVPEPSSWALMAGGIGLLAWVTGRRRTSRA
jgi:hypothetical protein